MTTGTGPNVSVVIPMRNAASTLDRCLSALLPQLAPQDEVVVVDNNSSDDSAVRAARHPGVRVLAAAKQGAYAARNVGCAAARGEVLAFLDPDCEPVPGWRRAIALAFQPPAVLLMVGRRSFAHDGPLLRRVARYENVKAAWVYGQSDPRLYFGYTNNMAVRRSLWREVGPFAERWRGADTIFVRRAVDRHGAAVSVYVADMHVRHLEIDRLRTYYRKMHIYGRSRRLYQSTIRTRPLDTRERWRVLRAAARDDARPLVTAVALTAALSVGLVAWSFGSLSARWARHRDAEGPAISSLSD